MNNFLINNFTKFIYIVFYLTSFAYLSTHFFFLKRKADQDYSYFLIDPNIRVYCYIFAFFFFIIFYRFFYGFFFANLFFYKIFSKHEFEFLFFFFFLIFYRFFWSYIFLDTDIKKAFFFDFNLSSQKFKPIQWEFSMYFFNFFGLFFDIYLYRMAYFYFLWLFFYNFLHNFFEKCIVNALRICTFTINIYCYSGESYLYDISRRIFLFFFFWMLHVSSSFFLNSFFLQ